VKAAVISLIHSLAAIDCQTSGTNRPPGARARAMLVKASTGRPKNIAPVWLMARSKAAGSKRWIWASAWRNDTLVNPSSAACRRASSSMRDDRSTPSTLRSLDLRTAAIGPDNPELASTLNNLAAIHRAQRRFADAAEDYRRALDLLAGTVDERHPTLLAVRAGLADIHLRIDQN
jgi:hypothetical protein